MASIICVALAVYFESRGEPLAGQYAVASVVWNRVNDDRWPSTACEVVFQEKQFASIKHVADPVAWYTAIKAASHTRYNPTTKAFFFATPGHHKKYKYLESIGNHNFFTVP